MTVEQSLIAVREDLLRKLRALAPTEMAELERVEIALGAIGQPGPTTAPDLSHLDTASAMTLLLRRAKSPMPKAKLLELLIAAGVQGDKKGTRPASWKLMQSIGYHVDHGRLTLQDGLVGLPEWESSEGK